MNREYVPKRVLIVTAITYGMLHTFIHTCIPYTTQGGIGKPGPHGSEGKRGGPVSTITHKYCYYV